MTGQQRTALLVFIWFAMRANKGDEFSFPAAILAAIGAFAFLYSEDPATVQMVDKTLEKWLKKRKGEGDE